MSRKKAHPVTTGRLPVVKCSLCTWSRAVRPGENASALLTAHYQGAHP